MLYKNWLKDWFKVYKEPYITKQHAKFTKAKIKNHIPLDIINKDITKLNAFEIQKAIQDIKPSKIAVDVYRIYKASIKMAYKLDYIKKDIGELLVKPKHTMKIGQALTDDELQEFLEKIKGTRCESYFKFCLYSGCRRSEALKINWLDIDFQNNLLHIEGTKTISSNRIIPIFDDLAELLRELIKTDCFIDTYHELAIPYLPKLFHHRKDYVTHEFKKYCPNHKLHDLRHTFATKCLECGISMKVVQSWLGHSDFETTANIYSHTMPSFSKNESQKLKF